MADAEEGEVEEGERVPPPTADSNEASTSGGADAADAANPKFAGLSPAEARKKLKKMRKKVEQGKGVAADYYNVYGPGATASVELKVHKPVECEDLQNLIMWVLADGTNPTWAFVKNKPLVDKVVVIFMGGLGHAVFDEHKGLLRMSRERFGEPILAQAHNEKVKTVDVATHLLTSTRKAPKRKAGEEGGDGTPAKPPFPPSYYALTPQERKANNYPVGEEQEGGGEAPPDGYVATLPPPPPEGGDEDDEIEGGDDGGESPPAKRAKLEEEGEGETGEAKEEDVGREEPLPEKKAGGGGAGAEEGGAGEGGRRRRRRYGMLAMDCEMCYTEDGLTLTRMSVVDQRGRVALDTLVRTDKPILDYNTRYSGITAEMMEGVDTSLADVQARLLKMVSTETILVGHSLENDLRQARLFHQRVIDTALLYPHPRGPPYKPALRKLAEMYLDRKIQVDTHDSVDDARATMDLAKLKIRHGPSFGESGAGTGARRESLCEVLGRAGRRVTLVDQSRFLRRHATGSTSAIVRTPFPHAPDPPLQQAQVCATDDEAVEKACREVGKEGVGMVWVGLGELSSYLESKAIRARKGPLDEAAEREELRSVLRRMDARLCALHGALRTNTLAMVATGVGDSAHVRRLMESKIRRRQGLEEPPWSAEDDAVFDQACLAASKALVFAHVKGPEGAGGVGLAEGGGKEREGKKTRY